MKSVLSLGAAVIAFGVFASAEAANVTTYHNDNYRTGWDQTETVLTPRRILNGFHGKTFKMTSSVTLDEQVDAQPLVVTGQPVSGQGTHDVVYVATENNTLYAIDANDGTILLQRNFGTAVPISALPGHCGNNSQKVGIDSTPVIDSATGTMYLIAYTFPNSTQEFDLHAVDLATLNDVVAPVVVTAQGTLTDNSTYNFNAAVSRQRAALLLASGNVYAGFASFCDIDANLSRGWVLGWQKDTLSPLAANDLTNKLKTSPDNFFLTSVWMSGYGLAASPDSSDIYFITGNSDFSGNTIDAVTNIAESAVQISSDLATVKSVFTPDNAHNLEQSDADYGSGGFLLLPPQPGDIPNIGMGAGKDGNMYVLNADNLNNFTSGADRILAKVNIGACWCGQTYFVGADGKPRIVSSGGASLDVWKLNTKTKVKLKLEVSSSGNFGSQSPGFFTSISSNGTKKKSAVVWAVSRADSTAQHNVKLFAFDPAASTGIALLTSTNAGKWPNTGGNANIVPTVANGHVYVASYKQLAIFGMSSAPAAVSAAVALPNGATAVALPAGVHEFTGTVRSLNGKAMTVMLRNGTLLGVDMSVAIGTFHYAQPAVGDGVLVHGSFAGQVFAASIVMHAKNDPSMWQADR